ncbi:MAG: DUF4139 domain-containing protein [Bacteroidales bacterium]|nr:DUF4139 domain-containing protein [Bacteroidales bacterium]
MNKTNLVFLSSMFLSILSFTQEVKRIDTRIESVTVFFAGAEIERVGKISLSTGVYELVLGNLPPNVNPSSVYVEGKGDLTILFVEFRNNYLGDYLLPKVKVLKDSIQLLQKQIKTHNNALAVLNAEEEMIKANKVVGGQNTGLNVDVLKATADFIRSRLADVKSRQQEEQEKVDKLTERLNKLNAQLQEIQASSQQPVGEIAIQVKVNNSTNAQLQVKYYIPDAGWRPFYDVHVKDIQEKAHLTLKAQVYQNTSENWDNIRLTLSTANPRQNNIAPVLDPWYLYLYDNYPIRQSYYDDAKGEKFKANAPVMKEMDQSIQTATQYTESVETPIHVLYKIDLPYTIEGNGRDKIIEVTSFEINTLYRYYVVPKLATEAYLLARLTDWEGLNLLPGEASVFLQNAFVGKTYINPTSVEDTMEISLGIDKSISVQRERIKDFTSKSILGNYKKINKGWEITIKNNKNKPVTILIQDQFPISTNKDLTVDQIEKSDGILDEKTGIVSWVVNLKPGEVTKKTIKYSVKFPKNKVIYLE